MNARGHSCERALELELKLAAATRLSRGDELWLAEHRANCESCALESEALLLLEQDTSASPAEPLDDIARRRFIDDVLYQAEVESSGTSVSEETGRRSWTGTVRFMAAVAAVAAFVVIATRWLPSAQPQEAQSIGPQAASSVARYDAIQSLDPGAPQFLLLSGDVRVEGRQAAVGLGLRNGQRIETQSGSAVVAIGDGIFIELSPATRASIDYPLTDAVEIVLETGAVLSSVDPFKRGPKLSIVTPHGRVTVTGTIFSVEVGDDDSFVRVARGKVEIDSADSVAALLPAGRGKAMLSGADRELPAEERQGMTRREQLFGLLDRNAEGVVDISSVPLGAEVAIDGTAIGATPVIASLRFGPRDLSLRVHGENVVRELLDIAPGAKVERVFDLSFEDTTAAVEPEPVRRPSTVRFEKTVPEQGPSPVSAEQLLFEAQALRVSRQWRAAAQIYERIVAQYPSSESALSALVSLGTIELEKLSEPRSALKRFNLYLARGGQGGPLAQEALYGKAKALRSLGLPAEEKEALTQLVEQFSRSLYSQEARARLAVLEMESK